MLRLNCVAQNYEWGVKGRSSAVGRLLARGCESTHTRTDGGDAGAAGGATASPAPATKQHVDEDTPYAEYWFGTHSSGHSRVETVPHTHTLSHTHTDTSAGIAKAAAPPAAATADSPSPTIASSGTHGMARPPSMSRIHAEGGDVLLHDYLMAHPRALGVPPDSPSSALPYLFKVLSVAKALSIQAHPDKERAKRLHASNPSAYKDDNHKPEMAVALTPFEAMCQFRPAEEIARHAESVPELAAMIGKDMVARLRQAVDARDDAAFRAALRDALQTYMSRPEPFTREQTSALEARLRTFVPEANIAPCTGHIDPDTIALRLCMSFPNDLGVFAPYLLNVLTLQPAEGIFLAANEPHAYLAGDCMEVMACSDNVVRAGLTPKFKDVPTLVEMLTYNTGAPRVDSGARVDPFTVQYVPPVREFFLQRTELDMASGPYQLPPVRSAAIIVVLRGEAFATSMITGTEDGAVDRIEEGQIWLQPADCTVTLTSPTNISLYRAATNPYVE